MPLFLKQNFSTKQPCLSSPATASRDLRSSCAAYHSDHQSLISKTYKISSPETSRLICLWQIRRFWSPPPPLGCSVYLLRDIHGFVSSRRSSSRNFEARNLSTRRHEPHLSPANPPVLISATASRLLRLSFERHPRFRLVKTKLLQKFRSRKVPHAPPRAGEASSLLFASDPRATHRPRAPTRSDPRPVCPVHCWRQP